MQHSQHESTPPQTQAPQRARGWALPIGCVAGIPLYIHATFLLLPLYTQINQESILLTIALFGCVALHELGHALMARRFGIQTEEIVLYPIGGVARLRGMGRGLQEFWIAIAGPAVNVAIATLLYFALHATHQWVPMQISPARTVPFFHVLIADEPGKLQYLMLINVLLLAFNMLPAFPMDGGRVVRALLSLPLGQMRATMIAATIGQLFAIGFAIEGIFLSQPPDFMLAIIGVFIYGAASREKMMARVSTITLTGTAREAMVAPFTVLPHGATIGEAAETAMRSGQHDFPVVAGTEVIGIVTGQAIQQAMAAKGGDHYIAELAQRELPHLQVADGIQKVLELLQQAQGHPLLVYDGEILAGFINQQSLAKYLSSKRVPGLV